MNDNELKKYGAQALEWMVRYRENIRECQHYFLVKYNVLRSTLVATLKLGDFVVLFINIA